MPSWASRIFNRRHQRRSIKRMGAMGDGGKDLEVGGWTLIITDSFVFFFKLICFTLPSLLVIHVCRVKPQVSYSQQFSASYKEVH